MIKTNKYPEEVIKDIMIIDQAEKLYWRNHEIMSEKEFAECIKSGTEAAERLHGHGFNDLQIRELWVEVVKPLYDSGDKQ